jgi:hypothetical protein
MTSAHQVSDVAGAYSGMRMCSMPGACAQAGILAIGLIACRHNVTCVSMMPFSSAEMNAKSMCYHRCAYAPQTRGEEQSGFRDE